MGSRPGIHQAQETHGASLPGKGASGASGGHLILGPFSVLSPALQQPFPKLALSRLATEGPVCLCLGGPPVRTRVGVGVMSFLV